MSLVYTKLTRSHDETLDIYNIHRHRVAPGHRPLVFNYGDPDSSVVNVQTNVNQYDGSDSIERAKWTYNSSEKVSSSLLHEKNEFAEISKNLAV